MDVVVHTECTSFMYWKSWRMIKQYQTCKTKSFRKCQLKANTYVCKIFLKIAPSSFGTNKSIGLYAFVLGLKHGCLNDEGIQSRL